jgi:large subunit ribosomal protein L18
MIKNKVDERKRKRAKIKMRIRKKVHGTSERPRLVVNKTRKYIYAQAIDDDKGNTIAFVSSLEKEIRGEKLSAKNVEIAKKVGETIAEKLIKQGVKKVVFDRNGYIYHGKIKAIADGAREKGLKF